MGSTTRLLELATLTLAIGAALVATAQASPTVLYSETFEGTHGWTLNVSSGSNGQNPNPWIVSDTEGGISAGGCAAANNGNKTLHVFNSQAGDISGAAYDAGGLCGIFNCPQTSLRSESPTFSTSGQSNLTLEFDYVANGDALTDNASVLYDAGNGWTLLEASLKSTSCQIGLGRWTHASIALPFAAENKPSVRIAFNWTNNDDGIGTDPSVAINDVVVSADPPLQTPTATSPSATTPTPTATPTATASPTIPAPVVACPTTPQTSCLASRKDTLTIDNDLRRSTGLTKWRFKQGPELVLSDFGNPMTTTGYSMCLYIDGILTGEANAAASPTLWQPIGKKRGFDYANRSATQGEIERMRLDTLWGSGLVASGNFYVAPVSGQAMLQVTTSVRLQLISTAGTCFDSTFTPTDIRLNNPGYFRAQKG